MKTNEIDRSTRPQTMVSVNLDAVGWGLLLMWVGAALFASVGWPVFILGVGLIMLGGQAARSHFGVKLDWFALVLGACFAAFGGLRILDVQLGGILTPAWIVPAAFVAAGAAVVMSAWLKRAP